MKKIAIAALAAALAACGANPSNTPAKISGPESMNIRAPAPQPAAPQADHPLAPAQAPAVVLDLKKDDAGKTFTLQKGQRFSVSLVGVPTAGYLWSAPHPPAFLKQLGDEAVSPTHSDQLKPGFTGGTHWEVTVFEAAGAGKGELRFEQRRPWEKTEPPAATWSAIIEVK